MSFQLAILALLVYLAMLGAQALNCDVSTRLSLSALATLLIWAACGLSRGVQHPISLYVLISSPYVLAGMVEVVAFGNRVGLPPERMAALTGAGVGFLIAAAISCLAFGRDAPLRTERRLISAAMPTASLAVSVVLFVAAAAMTISRYGLTVGSMSRAELYSDLSSVLSFVRGLLAVSLGVAAAVLIAYERQSRRRLSVLRFILLGTLATYAAMDLLILGDRRLPLTAAIAVGAVLWRRRVGVRECVVALSLALLLFLFGYVRNTPPTEWATTVASGEILDLFSPAASEFGGMAIIGTEIDAFASPPQDFPTYESALLQQVPKAILPGRPLSPTEWFVWTYFPSLAASGGSFAFNAVIEALLNVGAIGVVLIGTLVGALIAIISKARFSGAQIGIPIAVYVFSFSMRMDFASILRSSLVAIIGATVVLVVATLVTSPALRGTRTVGTLR